MDKGGNHKKTRPEEGGNQKEKNYEGKEDRILPMSEMSEIPRKNAIIPPTSAKIPSKMEVASPPNWAF